MNYSLKIYITMRHPMFACQTKLCHKWRTANFLAHLNIWFKQYFFSSCTTTYIYRAFFKPRSIGRASNFGLEPIKSPCKAGLSGQLNFGAEKWIRMCSLWLKTSTMKCHAFDQVRSAKQPIKIITGIIFQASGISDSGKTLIYLNINRIWQCAKMFIEWQ